MKLIPFRNKRNHKDVQKIRDELEGILQLIRFPLMSADDFARGPAVEGILTAEVEIILSARDESSTLGECESLGG